MDSNILEGLIGGFLQACAIVFAAKQVPRITLDLRSASQSNLEEKRILAERAREIVIREQRAAGLEVIQKYIKPYLDALQGKILSSGTCSNETLRTLHNEYANAVVSWSLSLTKTQHQAEPGSVSRALLLTTEENR